MSLIIVNGDNVIEPEVLSGVKFTTERSGVCGKMTFDLMYDGFDIKEGNVVEFTYDGYNLFQGYIFKKSMKDRETMSITAYDQLRYLKNKDTYNFIGMTCSDIVKQIAGDFDLRLGDISDTSYKIASLAEKDKSLFDMIEDAIALTCQSTGELFVLYDNFGSLCLKNISELKTGVLIDAETAQGYSYESSIDENTYNNIKLYYEDSDTGVRSIYIANDEESQAEYGVLQYYDKLKEGENGKEKADKLLDLYNSPLKSLTVSGAIGHCGVIAGRMCPVQLEIGDEKVNNYMLVEKCTHKFENRHHTMDLTLRGGVING